MDRDRASRRRAGQPRSLATCAHSTRQQQPPSSTEHEQPPPTAAAHSPHTHAPLRPCLAVPPSQSRRHHRKARWRLVRRPCSTQRAQRARRSGRHSGRKTKRVVRAGPRGWRDGSTKVGAPAARPAPIDFVSDRGETRTTGPRPVRDRLGRRARSYRFYRLCQPEGPNQDDSPR